MDTAANRRQMNKPYLFTNLKNTFTTMGKIILRSNLQKIACQKTEGYLTRSVTYTRINADKVLDYAAANSGINRGMLAASMHAIVQTFDNFLMNGHSVELPEVGSFRFGVKAHSGATREEAGAQMVYRRKVLYAPSVKVKSMLNAVELSTMADEEKSDDDSRA